MLSSRNNAESRVTTLPAHYLAAVPAAGAPLERDGLVPWEPALFADAKLAAELYVVPAHE